MCRRIAVATSSPERWGLPAALSAVAAVEGGRRRDPRRRVLDGGGTRRWVRRVCASDLNISTNVRDHTSPGPYPRWCHLCLLYRGGTVHGVPLNTGKPRTDRERDVVKGFHAHARVWATMRSGGGRSVLRQSSRKRSGRRSASLRTVVLTDARLAQRLSDVNADLSLQPRRPVRHVAQRRRGTAQWLRQ